MILWCHIIQFDPKKFCSKNIETNIQIITRAWYDWNTPHSDDVTEKLHRGHFGYAYGIVFHYGKTDGLEREFIDQNNTVKINNILYEKTNLDCEIQCSFQSFGTKV